jgi:lysyl endopeptidase
MVLDNISGAQGVHWRAEWDPTPAILPGFPTQTPGSAPPSVTEGGSSGSPLYSAERRVVGVLSGGPSACGSTGANLRDQYGGLFHAWEGVGTPTTRMRDALDPAGLNPLTWDGIGSGSYTLVGTETVKACAGGPAPTASFRVESGNGATAPVNFTAGQTTAFSAVSFNPNPATPSPTGTPVTVSATLAAGLSGAQTLPVSAASADNSFQLTLNYEVFPQAPGTLTLNTPAAGATNVPLTPAFGWSAATNVDQYELEFSRDAQFSGIVGRLFTGTSGSLTLRGNTTYFWRVRAVNPCGPGAFASSSFTTVANDTVFSDGFYE